MARSIFNATAGSGFKFATYNYTDGADSKHDEVMVLGEQFLPTYIINNSGSGGVSVATANSHFCQVMAGASLKLRIRRIEVWLDTVATTVDLKRIHVVRLTTAGTGGTVTSAGGALDPSSAAIGATGMILPTVKGTEGAIIHTSTVYWMQTLAVSSQLTNPILVIDFDRGHSEPLIIAAGTSNGIALKNISAVAGATVQFNVWVSESAY